MFQYFLFMKVIYLSILVTLTLAQDYFVLHKHQDPAARCLNGSPAALYFHKGKQFDKFVIYFEGGGLCRGDGLAETIEYCYQESLTI